MEESSKSTYELLQDKVDLIQSVCDLAYDIADNETVVVDPKACLQLWRSEFLQYPFVNNILKSIEDMEE